MVKAGRPASYDFIYAGKMGVSKRTVKKAGGAYKLEKLPIAVQRILLGISE